MIIRRFLKLITIVILVLFIFSFAPSIVMVKGANPSDHPDLTFAWSQYCGPNAATNIMPLAADLNNDGRTEIIVTGGPTDLTPEGTITCLDSINGNILWQRTARDLNGGIDMHTVSEITDLYNDGRKEIIISTWNGVVALDGKGQVLWHAYVPSSNTYPAIADINGDGHPELFVSGGNGPSNGYEYITSLNYNGQVLCQGYTWHPCFGGMTIGDPKGDGHFILYQNDRCYDYFDPEDPYTGGGLGVHAYDANTLKLLWTDPSILCSSNTPVLADVTHTGTLNLVTIEMDNHGIAVLNAIDGSIDATGGIYRKGATDMPGHSSPTVFMNPGGSGHLDFIDCNNTQPLIWDLYSWAPDGYLPNIIGHEPPKAGHITADNNLNLVGVNLNDNSVCVFEYNPNAPGKYQLVDRITGLVDSVNDFSLIQDVNNDGKNELILTTTYGAVYMFNSQGSSGNPPARTGLQFYSERKDGVSEYVPPFMPSAPAIVSEMPLDGSTNQSPNPQLQIKANSFQNLSLFITFQVLTGAGIWNTLHSWSNVPSGIYNFASTGMNSPGTTYTWRAIVSDGSNTASKTFRFTTTANPPTQATPTLSTDSNGNLICYGTNINNPNGFATTSIYNWKVNGAPITVLNLPFDTRTSANPLASDDLVFEGFENGFQHLTNSGWDITSSDSYTGVNSAHTNGNGQTLTSNTIDASKLESFTVSFNYLMRSFGTGSVTLQFYNGNTYIDMMTFSNNPQNSWQSYSIQSRDPRFLIDNLKIRLYSQTDGGDFYLDNFKFSIPVVSKDYSGLSNDATIHRATWSNNGVVGGAYSFDGATSYMRIADDPSLGGSGSTNQLSIEFWVNPSSSYENGAKILTKYDPTLPLASASYMIGFETQGTPNVLYWGVNTADGWNEVSVPQKPLSPGAWYHVVCTYQSGSGLSIYINGVLMATSSPVYGNIAASHGVYLFGAPLFIGTSFTFSQNSWFNGLLDNLRIYSRSLSAAQAQQLYLDTKNTQSSSSMITAREISSGDAWTCDVTPNNSFQNGITLSTTGILASPPPSGMIVANWHFDEDSGTTAYDSSSYQNNGLIDGASWTTGKINSALSFNGVNNYVSVPASNSLSGFTQGFTVEAWVMFNDTKRQALIQKFDVTQNNGNNWFIDYNQNSIEFFASSDGTSYVQAATYLQPTLGNWYHIAVVWQSNQAPKFYINGQQSSTIYSTGSISSIYNNPNIGILIGKCPYDSSRYFNGKIDEVKLYSSPLTSSQIEQDAGLNGNGSSFLFQDGFESGNTNLWTGNFNQPLNIVTNPTHMGSYAVQYPNNLSNENDDFLFKTLPTTQTQLDVRTYFQVKDLSVLTVNDKLPIVACSVSKAVNFELANAGIINDGGTLKWWLYWHGNGVWNNVVSTLGPIISSNTWYSIELKHIARTQPNSNGEDDLYIDGQLVASVTGINNSDRGIPDTAILGGYHPIAINNLSWYADDFTMSTNYIGP